MTIKGIHHVALSVSDIDRSIRFYCDLLGMQLLRRGEFAQGAMDRITRLRGTRGRSAMLRAGGQHIELFEFAAPQPKAMASDREVCDHGITHFCIHVERVQEEYERLRAAGVEFNCAPQAFGVMWATYGHDPDGNIFELLEIPQ
jgi:glyoxylase I family protein